MGLWDRRAKDGAGGANVAFLRPAHAQIRDGKESSPGGRGGKPDGAECVTSLEVSEESGGIGSRYFFMVRNGVPSRMCRRWLSHHLIPEKHTYMPGSASKPSTRARSVFAQPCCRRSCPRARELARQMSDSGDTIVCGGRRTGGAVVAGGILEPTVGRGWVNQWSLADRAALKVASLPAEVPERDLLMLPCWSMYPFRVA